MRRRQPPAPPRVRDGVPDCLRAGVCIEVWASDGGAPCPEWSDPATHAWYVARRRYKDAVELYRQRHGIGDNEFGRLPFPLKCGAIPWSFGFLAATDPDRLAQQLDFRGLPQDWQPTPAPAEWLEAPKRERWVS